MNKNTTTIRTLHLAIIAGIAILFSFQSNTAKASQILFQDDDFQTVPSQGILIDSDGKAASDLTIQFGASLSKTLKYSTTNARFEFNDKVDFGSNEITSARIENVTALPGGATGLGTTGRGRIVQLTANDTIAPGCSPKACSSGTYAWNGATWVSFGTTSTTNATKIVTVGPTGRDYTTISAAAAYLNTLSGGMIWIDPGTFPITSTVDLENVKLVGSDTTLTTLSITGSGKIMGNNTTFNNLAISVDSAITAAMGIDLKYNTTSQTALDFNQVDFIVNGSKVMLDSTATTKPTANVTIQNCTESSGTGTMVKSVSTANLNSASNFTVIDNLSTAALKMVDWSIKIIGGSNVVTSGTITSIPDRTISVSPGMNIQAAIDSLGANGGVVKLLVGTHTVTNEIYIDNDNIALIGEGPGTIVRATTATWVGGTSTKNGVIQVGASNGTSPHKNVVISNFKVEVGPNIDGIRVSGGSDNKVIDMMVTSIGTKSNTHVGIVFTDGATSAATRFTASRSIVNNDTTANRWVDGVHFDGDAAMTGLQGYGNGITDSIISEMMVSEAAETSYVFSSIDSSGIFSNRARNVGWNSGAFGLFINNANGVVVMNNTIDGNNNTSSTIGISLYSNVIDSIVTSNSVRGGPSNFTTGIDVRDSTSQNNYVNNNRVINATTVISDNGTTSNPQIGAGTASPTTTLDINGNIAIRKKTYTANNGNNNNINIGNYTFIKISGPNSQFTITGISGGTEGEVVILYNTTNSNMIIANENTNSTAANRITTLTGGNSNTNGAGTVTLMYDSTAQRWIVVSIQQ